MLISEFARRTGLGRETVRFYVRMGLLQPQQTKKGGRHPYLMFSEDDVSSVDTIRVGQMLGLSLREISELREARYKGELQLEDRIAMMRNQLLRLEARSAELERLKAYVRAKIAWQEEGEPGVGPQLYGLLIP